MSQIFLPTQAAAKGNRHETRFGRGASFVALSPLAAFICQAVARGNARVEDGVRLVAISMSLLLLGTFATAVWLKTHERRRHASPA